MNVNGTYQLLEGMSFTEIGEVLQQASPAKDGFGLKVELTMVEEIIFGKTFGMRVGMAICDVIADAVRANGGNPEGLRYTYTNRVFQTPDAA